MACIHKATQEIQLDHSVKLRCQSTRKALVSRRLLTVRQEEPLSLQYYLGWKSHFSERRFPITNNNPFKSEGTQQTFYREDTVPI